MPEPAEITHWMHAARAGDEAAAQNLWNHYFGRTMRLARSRMAHMGRQVYDEEDAAISAMNSFFRGIEADRFPELHDRNNLWRVLVILTKRKVSKRRRSESAKKRGGPIPSNESPTNGDAEYVPIEQIICEEPTAEFVVEMMDELEHRLAQLGGDMLRRIAVLRMDGFTQDEIAHELGCASRTVRRKLDRIQADWEEAGISPN